MKKRSFPSVETGYTVAEVEYDETSVFGIGGAAYPRLCIPLGFILRGVKGLPADMAYTDAHGQLALSNHGKLADALAVKLQIIGYAFSDEPSRATVQLEFPLDASRISQLERHRNGGDLTLQLTLELFAQQFGRPYVFENQTPTTWTMRYQTRLVDQPLFTIPRSVWTEKVLPALGYGTVHFIEFPAFPLESSVWKQSFQALQEAQELHKLGRYDDAVGKCRLALADFFDYVDKTDTTGKTRSVPVPKKAWQQKLGEATYKWLDASFSALKGAMNKPLHELGPHYDQFESQMIFAIAAAFVTYVARNVPNEGG